MKKLSVILAIVVLVVTASATWATDEDRSPDPPPIDDRRPEPDPDPPEDCCPGPPGEPGRPGPDGPQGQRGPQGAPGEDGATLYELHTRHTETIIEKELVCPTCWVEWSNVTNAVTAATQTMSIDRSKTWAISPIITGADLWRDPEWAIGIAGAVRFNDHWSMSLSLAGNLTEACTDEKDRGACGDTLKQFEYGVGAVRAVFEW